MSMLGFLFKDKGHTEDRAPAPTHAPQPARTLAPVPAVAAPAATEDENLDFDEIRNALDQIAEVLGRGEGYDMLKVTSGDVTAVEIKLAALMEVAGHIFSSHTPTPADEEKKATVLVEDIFAQLGNGKITITVSNLIADVPAEYLVSNINDLRESEVNLPLPLIVGSISPDELKKRTTHVERPSGVQDLPNLFTPGSEAVETPSEVAEPVILDSAAVQEPAADVEEPIADPAPVAEEVEAPPVAEEPDVQKPVEADARATISAEVAEETVETEAVEEPVVDEAVEEEVFAPAEEPSRGTVADEWVEEVPAAEPPVLEAPREEPVSAGVSLPFPVPVRQDPPAEEPSQPTARDHVLVLRGLDLNVATAEELVSRLDGIGAKLANRIVHNREAKGPFLDLLDLARVSGLGRKTFQKITGMRWPEGEEALPEMRSNVLSFTEDGYLSVKDVATRFGELPGFQGCVVVHQDGYVLASSWDSKVDQALGAFAPQIFKKVERYVRRLKMGQMDCMTVILDQCPITFVPSQDIYFIAIHRIGGISRRHIRMAHGVGCRLGRLLKGRAKAA